MDLYHNIALPETLTNTYEVQMEGGTHVYSACVTRLRIRSDGISGYAGLQLHQLESRQATHTHPYLRWSWQPVGVRTAGATYSKRTRIWWLDSRTHMRQVVTAGSYKPWYRYGAFEELFDSAARDGIILSDELITQTFGSIHEQLQEIWGQIRSLRTNRAPHLYTADNVA